MNQLVFYSFAIMNVALLIESADLAVERRVGVREDFTLGELVGSSVGVMEGDSVASSVGATATVGSLVGKAVLGT